MSDWVIKTSEKPHRGGEHIPARNGTARCYFLRRICSRLRASSRVGFELMLMLVIQGVPRLCPESNRGKVRASVWKRRKRIEDGSPMWSTSCCVDYAGRSLLTTK